MGSTQTSTAEGAQAQAQAQADVSGDILVVDDDEKNLMAMEVALGDLAGRLVKVRSGEEALRELLHRDYAVILLDVQMPDMDGFETAQLIRSRERTRHVPIIFVTAYSQNDQDIRHGYELGAVDYLFKPIVPAVLKAKVQVFVELRERTAEVARQAEKLRALEREEASRRLEEERRKWEAETLRRQNQQLEEADRRKDEFIAMLAHELRNPLSPLVTSLELMRMTELEDELVVKARDVMDRQVRHLTRLVDDLLDVSRISQGKIELHREPVDMRSIVEQALDTCRGAADAHGQQIDLEGSEEPVTLEADPVRLTQVVSNLLSNAVRYTNDGGRIVVRWGSEDGHATVSVRDTGRGIAPELLDRIWDMFVQERDGGKGLGLGLTLVKQLVEMHGGTVEALSEGRGTGSEFVVRLPLSAAQVQPSPESEDETDETGEPLRIALVDDDEDIRETVRSLLEKWGHTVAVAETGPKGADLVIDLRPDVAILDIGLPGLDGYEIAARIREEMGEARPRLVAMTGYGQEHDRTRALAAGFDAHLTKPAKPSVLRRALREHR